MPNWFDLAQDLTERWVHQMQMREAIDRVAGYRDDYVPVVIQTLVWAFPHQYRAAAAPGTRVLLDFAAAGAWTLTCDGSRWALAPGAAGQAHEATVTAVPDAAWRWLTGGEVTDGVLQTSGPAELVEPLLTVRAALV